jgi:hypothetical protein
MDQFMAGLLEYLGSGGNQKNNILSLLAVPIGPFAMATSLDFENTLVLEMQQRIHAGCALEIGISALSPVTATGSATRDKLLAPECHAAIPAVAGYHLDLGTIDKQATRSEKALECDGMTPILSATRAPPPHSFKGQAERVKKEKGPPRRSF